VFVVLFVFRVEKCESEGSEDVIIEDRRDGESERRFRRKVIRVGACVVLGVSVRLVVMRKWFEVCSGVIKELFTE